MSNPDMMLVCTALEAVVAKLTQDPGDTEAWSEARSALATCGVKAEDDPELSAAIEEREATKLGAIVAGWVAGQRLLLVRDREVLKRALKAFRKSLKVTLLDAESSLSGGHLSSGRESSIVGIVPPERYPRATWDQLVRQGRLVSDRGGVYGLGPNA